MNTIDFFTSIDDFKSFAPGVDASLLIESLYPSFLPTKSKIQDVITQKVYDALKDSSEPEEHKVAKMAMKSAIANYTMFKYKIFDAVSKNNSDQKLYKYQLEEIKEEYITMFWTAMDDLLRYLDDNGSLGEWSSSDQYKIREKLPIKGAKEFNHFFAIDNSPYFFSKIQFLINKINEDQIIPRVGVISDLTNEKLKEKCKRALCINVMAEAVILFDITELPKSIRNDVAHEFTKGGSAVQVREKLNSNLMKDVDAYYLNIERAKANSSGITENVVNRNLEKDKIYVMS